MTRKMLGERFWDRVDKTAANDCWEWRGSINRGGYGLLSVDNRTCQVHRVAYQMLVGSIPPGLDLDHLCRNRKCVNPAHLEPVTRRENVVRGVGPTAKKAAQVHCTHGHPLSGNNVYINSRGNRECRVCRRALRQAERARNRATRLITHLEESK